jgi:putative ABC transport system permease protein
MLKTKMIDIALKNVFRQKVRSALTIVGIAMGIGLIITLGSIGEGLNLQIQESFGDLAGVIDVRYAGDDDGITEDIIEDISLIGGVKSVVAIGEYRITRGGRGGMMMPRVMGAPMGGAGRTTATTMSFTAIDPEEIDSLIGESIIAQEGRKLDGSDDGAHVVLLGYAIANEQALNLDDEIEYERTQDDITTIYYFEVVGILEETGDSTVDQATYVPLKTMQKIEDDDTIQQLKVRLSSIDEAEAITAEINDLSDEIRATSPLAMVRRLEETLGTITMAVYGIGAVSIIVGGIGIMNTMIMSVMERRREIGVMKAIGATTNNILIQVLEESAVLSMIGGIFGFMMGYIAGDIIASNTTFTPVMSKEIVIIGFAFSLLLGMGAGLYPAWSASRLDPIKVLRYE